MKLFRYLMALLVCSIPAPVFAACHAVSQSGSGSHTGADWNNAFIGIPATGSLVRGDIYYLADGTYEAVDFNQSGTSAIELRKAQSYDFGSSCSPSIGAGWNAGTMGSGQAKFTTGFFSHMFYIESPGLVINGNGQQSTPGCGGAVGNNPAVLPATPSDCGILIDNTTLQSTDLISGPTGASTFTGKYIEILGSGNATTENYVIRADNTNGTTITHMYMHHFGAVCVVVGGASNLTFTFNYLFRNQITLGASPGHGQCLESYGDGGNFEVSRNVFRDLGGTAILMAWVGTGSVQAGPYRFYDNVIWTTVGFTPAFPAANGLLACINGFTCNNVTMRQNSIVGMGSALTGIDSETGGTYTVQNNIWYNDGVTGDPAPHGTFTEDHNSYLVSGTGCPTGTANVCNNTSPNPFNNWTGGDFTLASDGANWNNRVSLGAPYTTDVASTTFTTDRGAYQFGGSSTAPTVTTTTATAITTINAAAGGTVTSNGGASVTSEGTCYAKTSNPTTPCTSDGTATPFTSTLTGLSPQTLYHYRAFATNSVGTSYGSDLTFTTTICPPPYPSARCDLATVPAPTVPPQVGPNTCSAGSLNTCGNLTVGTHSTVIDPDFGSTIYRMTDSTTSPIIANSPMIASPSGSGDTMQINCLNNKVILGDTGGRAFPMNWIPGSLATRMYTGTFTNGFWMSHETMWWGRNCATHANTLFSVGNGLIGASSGYGTQICSWDFTDQGTAPTCNPIYDIKNCPGLPGGTGFSITWASGGEADNTDSDFVVGLSNSGVQDGAGALYVVDYRTGSGCRLLTLSTLAVTGDWGPTGAITGTTCATITIHNVKAAKLAGAAVEVATNSGCADAHGSTYVWISSGLSFGPQTSNNSSGHWTAGQAHFVNNPGNPVPFLAAIRLFGSPASPTGIIPNNPAGGPPTGMDSHYGWNCSAVLGDTCPVLASTWIATPITTAWENENIGINPAGTSNPWRFSHNFITGSNQDFFAQQVIGSGSQDGQWFIFTSDWEDTLGSTAGAATCTHGTNCRYDVFAVKLPLQPELPVSSPYLLGSLGIKLNGNIFTK